MVTVEPSPEVTAEDQVICDGETATLTAVASAGNGTFAYEWSTGATTASIDVTPGTTTNYSVTVTSTYTTADGGETNCTAETDVTVTVKPQPVAEITAVPTEICSGESVTFTATNTSAGTDYSWNFGANASPATANGAGPHVVTYTIPANQTADATATATLAVSLNGCSDEDTEVITIRDLPEPSITASTDPTTCEGADGTITVAVVKPAGSNVEISLDGGATFETCNQTTFSGLTAGSYTIVARYCDDVCEVEGGTVTLNDPDAPLAEINGPSEVCEEDSDTNTEATFSATDAGSGATYSWNFGADATPATATGRTPGAVTYATTGTKTVTLTVIRNGCTANDNFTITINDAPTPAVADVTVCAEEDATLIASVAGGQAPFTYLWSNGDVTPSITIDNIPATASYTVTVTDANGCSNDATGTINVNQLPVPDVSDDLTICDGESTTLSVENVFFGTAPFVYQWWNAADPGTILSTTTELTVGPGDLVLGLNNYFVRVTDVNGCFERDIVMVTVEPSPTVTTNDPTICFGETATLTAVAGSGNGTFAYEWSTGATTASIDVTPGTTTDYSVTVTSTYTSNDGGITNCTAEATSTVTVTPLPVAEINGDAPVCSEESLTFTATDAGAGADYAWSFGANASPAPATGAGPHVVTYSLPAAPAGNGTATVSLTVTKDNCV
jgi:PKD repeat protein